MKKILYTLLALFFAFGLEAQQDVLNSRHQGIPEKMTEFNFQNSNKANQSSAWFNYMRELMNIVSSMPYYRSYLFPDSTVRVNYSTGIGYVWNHSFGQVLDPTSNYFLLETQKISKSANYTLDSIALPYRYRRVQNAKPDTLIIQIFLHSQLTFVPSPSWTTPKSYARANYNYLNRRGDQPFKEIIVLLDDNDTITANQGIIQEHVGINVGPDEKIAVAFTYIPGNPFNVDDTIDFYNPPLPGNQINAFLVYDAVDENVTIDNNYYNHAMMVTPDVRYNISTNGWNGKYIPGVAFSSGNYQMDVFFRLTYDDFTGIENAGSNRKLTVSPNPASSVLNLNYDLPNSNQAQVKFVNMLGNEVYSQNLNVNGSLQTIDVSQWPEGVYFYQLITDGLSEGTARVVITR